VIAFERRACVILHNLLRSRADPRPFLLPANICSIVPETLRHARQPYELVDITDPTLEIDTGTCIERLRQRSGGYAGVVFVRPYGCDRAVNSLFRRLKEIQPDILVIDDKCLCQPDFELTGTDPDADVTLFSTGYGKHTDIGGGFAVLHDAVAYHRTEGNGTEWLDVRPPEMEWESYRQRVAVAMRASDEHKSALNAIYASMLPSRIQLEPDFQRWRFNILVAEPADLVATVFAAGLFASRHYPSLGDPGQFPVAERLHQRVVNLFNDRNFDERRARLVADLVVRHVGG
jgi:hypothetical protein